MLEIGVHPQVAASTSALMVLFASASATLTFLADGRLNIEYALIFGCMCCIAAFSGVHILGKAIKKHGASVAVFLLAGIIALGAVATAAFNGRAAVEQFLDGHLQGFHSFCADESRLLTAMLLFVL